MSKSKGIRAQLLERSSAAIPQEVAPSTEPATEAKPPKTAPGAMLDSLFNLKGNEQLIDEQKNAIDKLTQQVELLKGSGVVQEADCSLFDPNPYQPRLFFDPVALQELADSVRRQGLLQPIIVRREENNRFTIVAGERRWRAFKLAGLPAIPFLEKRITNQEMASLALIENVQRSDLSDFEKYRSFQYYKAEGRAKTIHELAAITDQSASTVGRIMSFEKLPEAAISYLEKAPYLIGQTSAEALGSIAVRNPEIVAEAIHLLFEKKFASEAECIRYAKGKVSTKTSHDRSSLSKSRTSPVKPFQSKSGTPLFSTKDKSNTFTISADEGMNKEDFLALKEEVSELLQKISKRFQ